MKADDVDRLQRRWPIEPKKTAAALAAEVKRLTALVLAVYNAPNVEENRRLRETIRQSTLRAFVRNIHGAAAYRYAECILCGRDECSAACPWPDIEREARP